MGGGAVTLFHAVAWVQTRVSPYTYYDEVMLFISPFNDLNNCMMKRHLLLWSTQLAIFRGVVNTVVRRAQSSCA